MLERILVPLDGSELAESVLPYVEELVSKLAPELKVEVTLFQVLPPTYYVVAGEAGAPVPYTGIEMEQLKNKAMGYLDKVGESLEGKGAIVECKVGIGKAAEEIIRATDEMSAGLVVMFTHGRSGLSQWAFGSVTAKVLRGGHRPVLLVRAPSEVQRA
jgi:nucleotide-binding universal stress UspA family protein